MISEQERIVRRSQGYDIGFEHNDKKYWINSSIWNEEKEKRLFQETGLKSFRETVGNKNLVFYNPEYFEISRYSTKCLHYIGKIKMNISQPINMSIGEDMFADSSVESLDLSNWNMCNVISTASMFSYSHNLRALDLSNWAVSNIKDMSYMFYSCTNLNKLCLKGWDVDNATSTRHMFAGCDSLHWKYDTVESEHILQRIIDYSNKPLEELRLF